MIAYMWRTGCLCNRKKVSGRDDDPSISIDRGPRTLPTAGDRLTAVASSLDPLAYLWSKYRECYIAEELFINMRLEDGMSF